MGVPELRARTKRLAEQAYTRVRSVESGEVVGELMEVVLGERGASVLETTHDMAFSRTGIVRGHYLFAQGNSLAVAIIDAWTALTGSARIRFLRPVRPGDRVVAEALVARSHRGKHLVVVSSGVGGEEVFRGQFVVAALGPS